MKKSDKPYVIAGSLVLLFMGPFGLVLWILTTVFVLALPEPKPRPVINRAQSNSQEASTDTLSRLKMELEAQALAETDPQVAAGIRRATDLVSAEIQKSTPVVVDQDVAIPQDTIPVAKPSEPLDQVVLMLYVGAFLLLGGMSLFIVYGGLADSLRLLLIIAMTFGMYGTGLTLFGARAALRPAGVAFLGIGLGMIPLTGYAATYLVQTDPHLTWFITSIVGLIAYVYALVITKAEVVAYLVFLMWLSLAQSAVTLFGGTLQWFAWVALIIAISTQLLLPYLKKYIGAELSLPFWLSSLVLVPLAVLLTWGQVVSDVMELWQLGVSLLLAGTYCLSAFSSTRTFSGSPIDAMTYAISAHILILLGGLVIAYDTVVNDWAFGYVLLLVAVAHLVGWILLRARNGRSGSRYEWLLFILTLGLAYISWIWLAEYSWLLVMGAVVTMIISLIMTYESLRQEAALSAIVSLLAIPPIVAHASIGLEDSTGRASIVLAVGYLVVSVVCIGTRYLIRNRKTLALFPLVGYALASAIAWFVVLPDNSQTFYMRIVVILAVLAIATSASYLERVPRVIAFAPVIFTSFIYTLLIFYTDLREQEAFAWSAIVTAALSYIYSLVDQATRGQTLLLASMIAMALAWFASASLNSEIWEIVSPCIGLWLAALLYVEKPRLDGGKYFELLPAFVATLAFVQLLGIIAPNLHILVYTHIWAAYGAFIWYVFATRDAAEENVSLAMYGTLALATFPVVIAALSEGSFYNLILLTQQTILLTVGMLLQNRRVSIWATIMIIAVVVYALRSFGYLQLVVIALLLISYALYRLLNQEEKP